jgi:hypothetical protein
MPEVTFARLMERHVPRGSIMPAAAVNCLLQWTLIQGRPQCPAANEEPPPTLAIEDLDVQISPDTLEGVEGRLSAHRHDIASIL